MGKIVISATCSVAQVGVVLNDIHSWWLSRNALAPVHARAVVKTMNLIKRS